MYQNFKFSLDDELINEFNEKDLCDYLLRLRNKAQIFLSTQKRRRKFILTARYMLFCRNIIADLAKFSRLNVLTSEDNVKLNSYTAAWWICRKPFQLKENLSKDFLYINESFAATLLFQATNLYDRKTGKYTVSKEKLSAVARHIMNYLKFQNATPQSLELFLNTLNV